MAEDIGTTTTYGGQTYIRLRGLHKQTRLLPIDAFAQLETLAKAALRTENSGYLHSKVREDAAHVLQHTIFTSETALRNALARAKEFRQAGVPPIFTAERESNSSYVNPEGTQYRTFPVVDYLINLFSTGRRPIWVTHTAEDERNKLYTVPVTLAQVRYFRENALRNPEFIPVLRKEIEIHTNNIFKGKFRDENSRKFVHENNEQTLDAILADMENMPALPKPSPNYDPEQKPARLIAKRRFWYTRFAPATVEEILTGFVQDFKSAFYASTQRTLKQFLSANTEYRGITVASKLFPSQVPLHSIVQGKPRALANSAMAAAITTGKYEGITQRHLINADEEVKQKFSQAFQDWLVQSAPNPINYHLRRDDLAQAFGITPSLAWASRDAFEKAHRRCIEALSDAELISYLQAAEERVIETPSGKVLPMRQLVLVLQRTPIALAAGKRAKEILAADHRLPASSLKSLEYCAHVHDRHKRQLKRH